MIANYHTHTALCRHAEGTVADYARAALEAGLRELGFSDHTPYWFPGDYYSTMRMFPHQLESYADDIRAVREEYRGKMQVHLGLEVEYYPKYWNELLSHLRDRGIEYMILGQHWLGSEIDEPYNGSPTEDESRIRRYCDQVIEAIQTGLFTYLAHPDLIRFTGSDRVYENHMRRLCREAKSCGVPLEINLLGLHQGRHYPDRRLWRIAGEENCPVVIGCDAHTPGALADRETYGLALDLAKEYDLQVRETIQLRRIQ